MYEKRDFKAGDKVLTPIGVGVVYKEEEFDIYLDEWHIEVVIGERFGFNRVITFGVNDLKPYKTPHERLLDLGWKVVDTDGIYKTYDNFDTKYTRMTMNIKVNKDKDGWYFTTHNVFMDKELTTILLDYLKELENE